MPFATRIDWKAEKPRLLELGAEGKTLREIGEIYGVTRQRIQQVADKLKIPNTSFGKGVARVIRQEAYRKKHGKKVDSDLYRVQRAKFRAKKSNSIRCGIDWEIHFGDLDWPVVCPVFGVELDYFQDRLSEDSPTFDRNDPDVGYVAGNVRIISWRANRIKNDGTAEEHERIAEFIRTNKTI